MLTISQVAFDDLDKHWIFYEALDYELLVRYF